MAAASAARGGGGGGAVPAQWTAGRREWRPPPARAPELLLRYDPRQITEIEDQERRREDGGRGEIGSGTADLWRSGMGRGMVLRRRRRRACVPLACQLTQF